MLKIYHKGLKYNYTEKKNNRKNMSGFVYDKRYYVDFLTEQKIKQILAEMEISVSSWNELLHFVGGALELANANGT